MRTLCTLVFSLLGLGISAAVLAESPSSRRGESGRPSATSREQIEADWLLQAKIRGQSPSLRKNTPLPYPIQLTPWLEELQIERFGRDGAPVSMMRLRRRWLQFSRARHADPMAIFQL